MNTHSTARAGFTLIELLVVVSIISMLSSVIVASLSGARERARLGAGIQFNSVIYHAVGDRVAGMWNLDECSGTTAADLSGSSNTGTLTSSPTWQSGSNNTPTGTGCSLSFNGSSYVEIPHSTSLNITGPFTVSAWVKPGSSGFGSWPVIVGKEGASAGYYLGYRTSGTYAVFGMNQGGVEVQSSSLGDLTKWHFVAGTFNGSSVKIYLDGKLSGSLNYSTNPVTNTNYLGIGRSSTGSTNFSGLIDDVKVYAGTISASEISRLYAEGLKSERFASK